MSRNPYYVTRQAPALRRSVFVFMDLLGYSEMIRKSEAEGAQRVLLRSLHEALSAGRNGLADKELPDDLKTIGKSDCYALKVFTEHIVIGWPVRDDAESEFGSACFKLGSFQLQMVLAGFFIRGALAETL